MIAENEEEVSKLTYWVAEEEVGDIGVLFKITSV